MHPVYHGIRILDIDDLAFGYAIEKVEKVLDSFNENEVINDINRIIDFYNSIKYIDIAYKNKIWDESKKTGFNNIARNVQRIIGKFLSKINDNNFLEYYHLTGRLYINEFWEIVDKYKIYERISYKNIEYILKNEGNALYYILKHKNIVLKYDKSIAVYMRNNFTTAEYILKNYFVENKDKLYFPVSLTFKDKEDIIKLYVDSDDPNLNFLRLVFESHNNEFIVSDKLKLLAKRKYDKCWKAYFDTGAGLHFETSIQFCYLENNKVKEEIVDKKERKTILKYSRTWIENNLDYATLLNNFIYLFDFVDFHYRCNFVAIDSELGILERDLGFNGRGMYKVGSAFYAKQTITNLKMQGYYYALLKNEINIDDIFKWFFEVYLKNEFHVEGFLFNSTPKETDILLKYKNLVSEMERVLKQYSLYCENKEIDSELLEISSKGIIYSQIDSLQKEKYLYVNEKNKDKINSEINILFSEQSLLGYTHKTKDKYYTFIDLINNEEINIEDYESYQKKYIEFLSNRGSVFLDNGAIKLNTNRVLILLDLYRNGNICIAYLNDDKKEIIKNMIEENELIEQSSLFSKQEVNYINYILNKSEFSNGCDLRNKYSHGTYPADKNEQERDYFILLKIMVLIILKINEEFCLIDKKRNYIEIV